MPNDHVLRRSTVAIGLAFPLVLSAANAQSLRAAEACARIADSITRLACYDTAFGVAKPANSPPPTVDSTVSSKFGDNPQMHHEVNSKADLPKSLLARVQQATSLPSRLYRLTLDNGQVWQTTEADWAIEFKVSDQVRISRLPLGGYQIFPPGGSRSVGARRVR
jgi:hypothetical protein